MPKDLGAIQGPKVIPNCAEVGIRWTLSNGRTARNVLHGRYPGSLTFSVGVANAIMTAITGSASFTALKPFLHSSVSLSGVDVRDLNLKEMPMFISQNAAVPMTGTAMPMAPQTALIVTLRTAKAGRSGRGRYYQAGWDSASNTTAGTASTAAQNALAAFGAALGSFMSPQGLSICLGLAARADYTSDNGTHHDARNATTELVTSTNVRNGIWDTQRRRAGRT